LVEFWGHDETYCFRLAPANLFIKRK
jgi:hypothetical protein